MIHRGVRNIDKDDRFDIANAGTGIVDGGEGADTITLTGGRNSQTGRQAPSKGVDGATCVFSPKH